MTKNEFLRHFPYASQSAIARNTDPDNQTPSPKPQCPVRDESVAATAREEKGSGRLRVRVISFRRRLIDPDNLAPKWFIDCLRYAGYIRDDRAQDIIVEVSQEKVATKAQEHTRIEIQPIDLKPPVPVVAPKPIADMGREELIDTLWAQCGSIWNRPAFNVFVETLSDSDLRYHISHGQ